MKETKELVNSEKYCNQIPERNHLVESIRKWGGSLSDSVLDPVVNIFSMPGITGFIGYRLNHGCAIVLGEPICDPNDVANLTKTLSTTIEN